MNVSRFFSWLTFSEMVVKFASVIMVVYLEWSLSYDKRISNSFLYTTLNNEQYILLLFLNHTNPQPSFNKKHHVIVIYLDVIQHIHIN